VSRAVYFPSPAAFRAWLDVHHASRAELLVGFYKRATGKPSLTWPESVDEALCYGWIDGIRRSMDAERYTIRFTPRRRGSVWSRVNTRRGAALIAEGRMRPAGLAAFERRDPAKTGIYSFERETAAFPPAFLAEFRANARAWAYFNARPPYYRRVAVHWVTSAKREETRRRRLAQLIARSAKAETPRPFDRKKPTRPTRPTRPPRSRS
jgi:uncharacterized protein YdeI (YjbR/CyaY-like superfamily)